MLQLYRFCGKTPAGAILPKLEPLILRRLATAGFCGSGIFTLEPNLCNTSGGGGGARRRVGKVGRQARGGRFEGRAQLALFARELRGSHKPVTNHTFRSDTTVVLFQAKPKKAGRKLGEGIGVKVNPVLWRFGFGGSGI